MFKSKWLLYEFTTVVFWGVWRGFLSINDIGIY